MLKMLSGNFKTFIENYDLSHNNPDRLAINSNYLAKNNCVLPGRKISEIFFLGTKFTDLDVKTQEERTYTLLEDFDETIKPAFERVLEDIVLFGKSQK